MQWFICGLMGGAIGVLNGLFGSGGGIVAVSFLRRATGDSKRAHATSVFIILFLSAVSAWLYMRQGAASISDALIYLPGGLVGAVLGGILLKKISAYWLRKIFAVFILYAAVRLLLR